ncbi:hypothetical protein B1H10_07255 [candidate division KSB1 bacterium 4484_188]|nr:MAG: hypothetical protein B1H10_07255 [candidate division KSB1 bacterium 4484_188]
MNNSDSHIIPVLAGIIFNRKNQVLLAQRKSGLSREMKWEFPGGKLKVGESPEECLRREIGEELGIDITVKQIRNILLLSYFCEYNSGEFRLSDHREVRWVPVAEIPELELSEADIPIAKKLVNG